MFLLLMDSSTGVIQHKKLSCDSENRFSVRCVHSPIFTSPHIYVYVIYTGIEPTTSGLLDQRRNCSDN